MMFVIVFCVIILQFTGARANVVVEYDEPSRLTYHPNPSPDRHRCGICPTYFQKICAFDYLTNSTYIFDNHCVMDLYNCLEATNFIQIKYEACVYFGNFAYVYGYKYEDMDYGEDHVVVKGSKKNPDFIRRQGLARALPADLFDFSD